ncbi:hypothetical protein KAM353_23860 [Aeromonas caviae]|uniref:Uncharacterized protein n=1 Tax=Aeromonas caviae TaxID=648 RepID=A0AA37CTX1_AERCA|nr:hypothetical protein KAM336_11510 [Aeromonas caviae]GJA26825.1 hypothetical protein KAM340_09920 [Aeromonas caviae]GJA61949.1 hypothetical protein KAM351_05600 [Aeromonas caviae]GJA72739.1 hypothetical protein KAM353_23860 [Aeromonas caviae]
MRQKMQNQQTECTIARLIHHRQCAQMPAHPLPHARLLGPHPGLGQHVRRDILGHKGPAGAETAKQQQLAARAHPHQQHTGLLAQRGHQPGGTKLVQQLVAWHQQGDAAVIGLRPFSFESLRHLLLLWCEPP